MLNLQKERTLPLVAVGPVAGAAAILAAAVYGINHANLK